MKRNRRQQGGGQRWLITYADMVTLILVFFVLLFAMSQIDITKFHSVTQSFQNRAVLDFLPSSVPGDEGMPGGVDDIGLGDLEKEEDEQEERDKEEQVTVDDEFLEQVQRWEQKKDALANLIQSVETFLEEEGLEDAISATRTEEGVILVLQDNILFDTGEAEILDSGRPFLDEVGSLLKGISNTVRVEGHTDNRPISTYRYPSNWELSGARAGSVVRYFIEEHGLDQKRFLIAGYGETRPVVENTGPENWSKNRRVEIVILDTDHDQAHSNE